MGADALQSNGITKKLMYLVQDKTLTPRQQPLHKVRKSRILLFVGVQLLGFGATFAITQTIGPLFLTSFITRISIFIHLLAAIGFPVIIMLLLPLRTFLIPKMPFTSEELAILDGPAASPFVSL